ncbi:MAG: DUF3488 and transglutaminase-like domain-containing protein [Proteobacteria bacterium]|nr:DUF3488 and transglutaminase-like domain-containing protein [Pseudomonadota bacterium]
MHKSVTYLISGLGLLGLGLGAELALPAKLAIALGWGASLFAEGRVLGSRRYAAWWTGAVALFLVVQLGRAMLTQPTLALAIEFAAAVQVSRLCNRRSAADYQQIAVLAFLHLVAATVLSTDVAYALVFVAFVVATPWMLTLTHLRREIEHQYLREPDASACGPDTMARVLASRNLVGPGLLLGTALLALPLFVLTATIFLAVPRVGRGFVGLGDSSGRRVAGFGDQVELGGFGVIRDDPSVVLRVMPESGIAHKAARLDLRLRGTSFDHYDGWRWTRSVDAPLPLRVVSGHYVLRRWPQPKRDLALRINVVRLETPVVFLPQGTVAVSLPSRSDPARMRQRLTLASGLHVRYLDSGIRLTYTAHVAPGHEPRYDAELSAKDRSRYLQLPPQHEPVLELARRWTRGTPDPLGKARSIQDRLRRSNEFEYSLNQPRLAGQNPLGAFLFHAKRGHCEYFSTAMAIMLRGVGVPARNVTGFVGGRYNPYGDYYALRQGDAHSWVEAFIPGQGWMTFDPTPVAATLAGPPDNLWSSMHAFLDAAQMSWAQSVVGYDLRTQLGLLTEVSRLMRSLRRARHVATNSSREPMSERGSTRSAAAWLFWGLGLAVVGGVCWLFGRRLGRRTGSYAPGSRDRDIRQAVTLYRDLERALARRGHPRRLHITPSEHIAALAGQRFSGLEAAREVTDRYLRTRFGGEPLPAREARRLRELVACVRARREPNLPGTQGPVQE